MNYVKLLADRRFEGRKVNLEAKPEAIPIDLQRTAVVVVDMQNAFCSKGGMLDQIGVDIKSIQSIIRPCRNLINVMRKVGCKIIYLQMAFDPELHACGGPNSPFWYKGTALTLMRNRPDILKGKPLIFGTRDAEIISKLDPEKDDIIIKKQRYSGFYGTNLEQTLFTYNIKYLIFIGVAANVCVESTLRDAFFLDYFPIIVSDAVHHIGPTFCLEATLFNIERYFGWVTTTKNMIATLTKKEVSKC